MHLGYAPHLDYMRGGLLQPVRMWAARLVQNARILAGLVMGIPIRLLAPLYRVEIQRIWAERIGHLAIEPELFLSLRESEPCTRTITIFFAQKPHANGFLLEMWRRVLPMGPSWLLGPIFEANKRWPWLNLAAQGWDEKHFDLRCIDGVPPHVAFTPDEIEQGRSLVRQLGVPEGVPFVCLAVRDSAYLTVTEPGKDWSYHNYRDSDISTYSGMADYLAQCGYAVLRMGAIVKSPLQANNPLVIDYATSDLRSDFGDVYLFANCAFCISTSTGMDSLAMLFRRPLGLVNLAGIGGMQIGGPLALIMCKNYACVKTGETLGLSSDMLPDAMRMFRTKDLTAAGLQVIDNTNAELVDFAREMVAITTGTFTEDPATLAMGSALVHKLHPHEAITEAKFLVSPSWIRNHHSV